MTLSAIEFGKIFPVIIVVIAVIYSLVTASLRAAKRKQKQGAKPPIADDTPTDSAEKSPEEQFDEIVKKIDQQRAASNAEKHERQKAKAQTQADKYRYDTRKNVTSVDDLGHGNVVTEAFPKEKPVATEKHVHPADKPQKTEKVKVEKRPSSAGSMGELEDEGCYEHGDIRYVLDEVESADTDTDNDTRELQRLMVWSELLDSPKFKKKH